MGSIPLRRNKMSFILTTLVAAAIFSLLVTRPGMRVLNQLCANFFDRLDWCFTTGLKKGLYEYSSDFGATEEEARTLETQLLLPLIYASAGFSLAGSWIFEFFGFSTAACLFLSFFASLTPFFFGLSLLGIGAVLFHANRSFGITVWNDWNNAPEDLAFASARPDTTPYTTADRVYDFFCDRGDALKSFRANPRGLMDFCDDLYDAGKARLLRKRSSSEPTP
jgi:hypothetical protein